MLGGNDVGGADDTQRGKCRVVCGRDSVSCPPEFNL